MTSVLLILIGIAIIVAIGAILLMVFGIKSGNEACIYIGAVLVAVSILLFVIPIQSLTKNV